MENTVTMVQGCDRKTFYGEEEKDDKPDNVKENANERNDWKI